MGVSFFLKQGYPGERHTLLQQEGTPCTSTLHDNTKRKVFACRKHGGDYLNFPRQRRLTDSARQCNASYASPSSPNKIGSVGYALSALTATIGHSSKPIRFLCWVSSQRIYIPSPARPRSALSSIPIVIALACRQGSATHSVSAAKGPNNDGVYTK